MSIINNMIISEISSYIKRGFKINSKESCNKKDTFGNNIFKAVLVNNKYKAVISLKDYKCNDYIVHNYNKTEFFADQKINSDTIKYVEDHWDIANNSNSVKNNHHRYVYKCRCPSAYNKIDNISSLDLNDNELIRESTLETINHLF
jgi:hypothetical protein